MKYNKLIDHTILKQDAIITKITTIRAPTTAVLCDNNTVITILLILTV